MTLGVHFALSKADERIVLEHDEEGLPELVTEDIEERYPVEWCCDTDRAWDAIHRAFNHSSLSYDFATPLQGVILGGKPLYAGDDFTISYKTIVEVRRIQQALAGISEEVFRSLYFAIDPDEYDDPLSEDDFAFSWSNLQDLQAFYARAAGDGRSVIFTVAQ